MSSDDRTVFVNFEKEMPAEHNKDSKSVSTSSVNVENEELNALYMELGKAYYEGGYEDPLPQLLPLFDKITKIKNLPKARICPQCGYELEEDARFCGKCGSRVV